MNIPNTKIAVTLYNLREYCRTYEDLNATLGKLRDIGYEAIQVSGVSLSPEQVKELADKYGMYICATHENRQNCIDDYDDILAKLKLYGCDFTALGIPGGDFYSLKGLKEFVLIMENLGERFKQQGIKFGFHNHHYEFIKITDKTWLEELYERTDPEKVYAELDVYWVTRGGGNPEAWIRKLAGRMPVIHLKDFALVNNEPVFCEVGEGNLDWNGIVKACEETGVRWYVVEQDQPFGDRDIFDSMKISFENLKRMGVR